MKSEICISGFGGQGVLAVGKSLIEAGMNEGLEVTWAPSYGPEMRGGTANCSVVISDEPIGSPVFNYPTDLIAMNKPSLIKFEPRVVKGGNIFVNSSVVEDKVTRTDVNAYYVPCVDIASELGNLKVANMVMMGAYVQATGIVHAETVVEMIKAMFGVKKPQLVPLNIEALHRGMEEIKKQAK